ncbi:hypothetical protein EJB05_08257, partial [Eragrostis curvula]
MAEEETRRLVGGRPARLGSSCWLIALYLSLRKWLLTALYNLLAWLSPASTQFPRPDPQPIRPGEPMDVLQAHRAMEESERAVLGGAEGCLAYIRSLVKDCLEHYHSTHTGYEYEPAPGDVTLYSDFHGGQCWTHGNFVARRKRYGCFKFLPAPRTLFFFELVVRENFSGIVTCTPLDEPVTEAYTFLGFPLGWGTRRNGESDRICEMCNRHCVRSTCACGHDKLEILCDICHPRSVVLHPFPAPGEFGFGFRRYRKLSPQYLWDEKIDY